MEAKEILKYLYIKYGGAWEKIYVAIRDREALSEEEQKRYASRIESLKSEGYKFWTILGGDCKFSDEVESRIKDMKKPPFVLQVYGDVDIITTDMVATDSTKIRDALVKAGFTAGVYDPARKMMIFEKSTGEVVYITEAFSEPVGPSDFEEGHLHNARRLIQFCRKVLLGVCGELETKQMLSAIAEGELSQENVYAIPGAAGSKINKLIKAGIAKFCDSTEDLLDKKEEE